MPRPQSKPPQAYEQFGQDFPSVSRAYEALGEARSTLGAVRSRGAFDFGRRAVARRGGAGPLDGKSREW